MDRALARQQAKELVSQMTLEEKASQLRYDAPAIDRLGVPAYNWWNEALHGVARAGTATVFPQAIGLAAIFDEDIIEEIADIISTEGRAKYNAQSSHGDRDIYKGLTFWSPNINIFRDPRWGRGQETYGEDPYLTGRMGAGFVRGIQGKGKYLKAAACAKHFAVHSGPEELRHSFDAQVSKYDLWDTYLPAFETLVKEAGVEAVMGAYNRTNGEVCCGSPTLSSILREMWGFEGHFVSDCGAINDFHAFHKVTDTAPESAALAINNGCDLNCGKTYLHLLQAVRDGLVTEEAITQACERLFTTRYLLGLFADDCEYDQIPYAVNDCERHAQAALKAAERSMVLLKNDGTLPINLSAVRSVAVIGPNADSVTALEGNYNGTSSRYVTYLEGIRAACREAGVRVNYSLGCPLYQSSVRNDSLEGDRFAEAVTAAQISDVSILVLGLDPSMEGEEGDANNGLCKGDKFDLELPAIQKKLLETIIAVGKPVVVLVASGSALRVEEGNAVIQAWYAGQAGGAAAANLIFGKVSPSGRLPVTFYKTADDLPAFTDYSMQGRTYRYFKGDALYPFGFGLSYTHFRYSEPQFDEENGTLTVKIRNIGTRDAEEVCEVYIKPMEFDSHGLNWSLCAFGRVALSAGEEKRVRLPIPERAYECVTEDGRRIKAGRHFRLYVGSSQPDSVSVSRLGVSPVEMDIVK
ncbi:MAG: glycoside hydrolase family 3 C-terminal domain-containing protein [Clostridiales bacterium]|nr:glycoside hydrolase family 3 C-terminal domain-containing protein [Clostridiales bacterium]